MYEKLINDINEALKTFEEKDYPKIYALLKDIVELKLYEGCTDIEIATMIDSEDMTSRMPEAVANIVIELYLSAAVEEIPHEAGRAYNNIGALYYTGRIGHVDKKKALEYYQKAGELGFITAYTNMGYAYLYGDGVDADYEKAYRNFSQGALGGDTEAMYKLGDMFRYGFYVDKNETLASIAYIKASQLLNESRGAFLPCDGKVYLRLGDMFYEGIGTDIDYDKAFQYYQSAERGLYEMIRRGDIYSASSLKHVQERLNEIKEKYNEDLPSMDWAEIH